MFRIRGGFVNRAIGEEPATISQANGKKRNFGFSWHTVRDDIHIYKIYAEPLHKVKASPDERSREPAGKRASEGLVELHAGLRK